MFNFFTPQPEDTLNIDLNEEDTSQETTQVSYPIEISEGHIDLPDCELVYCAA